MEHGNITYLKDLDLPRRDYTVKVRVIRLWKQPLYNNPDQFYSTEMIVVDEQGTTMQANVLRRWFPKFESLLHESECYYIVRPTIGLNDSKYKYGNNQNKLGIFVDSDAFPCFDFSGPVYGFCFIDFKDIIEKTVPDNQALDVIGFVADVKDLKKFKTSKGKDTKKVNVILQDLDFLQNSVGSSCSTQSSRLSGMFLSLYDEYVVRSEFVTIAEITLNEVKSVLIVGTVRMIQEELPWYYFACKTCHKKVTKKCDSDEHTVGVLVDQEDVFECKTETCNNTVIEVVER
ncbi:uncharacterized protein LOC143604699 [Bidens hawaiensis]|uniref:uncharacterized protein LOC143604699 n=1 Tax=Bidens hawaiensis TaxID=980011 RepID=UPI004049F4B2